MSPRRNAPSRTEPPASLPALRAVGGLRATRVLAATVGILFLAMIVALIFVPWQQNVRGAGRVIAFDPYDRRQTVAAPVMGRVGRSWVIEGSHVREGDPLVEIVDNDPAILDRLQQQRAAQVASLSASQAKVAVYEEQVHALEQTRDLAVSVAEQQVEVAQAKLKSEEHALEGARAAAEQATLNFARQRDLYAEGLASRAEFEVAERTEKETRAKLQQARQALAAAENELESKRADLGRVGTEARAKIGSARAEREAAAAEVASKTKQLSELDGKINHQSTQLVRAPRDGTILRLLVAPGAELVKAGDPLAVLVPETANRAVELWVDGNHVPLIHEGRPVRIQFEGWPAVQFAGWPSVAVGTFGGLVRLVDRTDDGTGRFRIVVSPDPEEQAWPDPEFLRQGARAKGFVLLDQVALGYELWRLANGFPPVVGMSEDAKAGTGKS